MGPLVVSKVPKLWLEQENPLTEDPYAVLAPFYELEFGPEEEDLALFLGLARRTGGPLLDVGAGTGRVAVALARAGFEVVALDSSRAMLTLARRKSRGALGRRLRLVEADVRDFQLNERFSLAIVGDNTFAHMVARQDQELALRSLKAHLLSTGLLVIVLQNPYRLTLGPSQNELVLVWEREGPGRGERTVKSTATRVDYADQVLYAHMWYDATASDGSMRRHAAKLTHRWFFRPELELLLERAGFQAEAWYGSYDLEPYSGDSPLLIALAKNTGK